MNFLSILDDDNKKIGLVAIVLAFMLETAGILTLFNRQLILLANLAFLFGIVLFVGFRGALSFFGQRSRLKASGIYFLGLAMITFMHMSFFGSLVQGFGLFVIFKNYLATIYEWLCRIPFIGKYLKSYKVQNALEKLSSNQSSI